MLGVKKLNSRLGADEKFFLRKKRENNYFNNLVQIGATCRFGGNIDISANFSY